MADRRSWSISPWRAMAATLQDCTMRKHRQQRDNTHTKVGQVQMPHVPSYHKHHYRYCHTHKPSLPLHCTLLMLSASSRVAALELTKTTAGGLHRRRDMHNGYTLSLSSSDGLQTVQTFCYSALLYFSCKYT